MRIISVVTLALVALLLLLLSRAIPAKAGGQVTNCSNDVEFTQRLGGGTATFNCGSATITLASTKVITQNTTPWLWLPLIRR